MSQQLMGKKRGMTHLYDETGSLVVCTVIEVEPNVVTQIKSVESDGYNAIQTGFETIKTKDPRAMQRRVGKPKLGHFKKAEVEPRRFITESRVKTIDDYTLGQEIGVGIFSETKHVDVIATTIGKGYQGGIKLFNFKGAPASHGAKKNHRSLGSTGNRAGLNFKNGKRPSQMGNRRVTVQNLKVVDVNEEENLIILKGAVPGPKNGLVQLQEAMKKRSA